jgi:hypothetical protein
MQKYIEDIHKHRRTHVLTYIHTETRTKRKTLEQSIFYLATHHLKHNQQP